MEGEFLRFTFRHIPHECVNLEVALDGGAGRILASVSCLSPGGVPAGAHEEARWVVVGAWDCQLPFGVQLLPTLLPFLVAHLWEAPQMLFN